MDVNELMEVGVYCDALLCHPLFYKLVSQFETNTMQSLLGTKPDQANKREQLYAEFQGLHSFLGLAAHMAQEARKLQEPPSEDQDDIEDIDCL